MFDPFIYAEQKGVRWLERHLPESLLGLYVCEPGIPPTILLSLLLRDNARLRRCVMAEEVGHHETSVGDTVVRECVTYQDILNIRRVEVRARRWAVVHLIPEDELRTLMTSRAAVTYDEAAARFEVVPAFMRLRMDMFASQHPEAAWLFEEHSVSLWCRSQYRDLGETERGVETACVGRSLS